jgi:hypothetical protein
VGPAGEAMVSSKWGRSGRDWEYASKVWRVVCRRLTKFVASSFVLGYLVRGMISRSVSYDMQDYVLPIDVDAIKATVLQQLHAAVGKRLAALGSRGGLGKVGGVGPAANAQEHLHVAVPLFEEVELLDAAVHIVAGVIPRVSGVVLVRVGPRIGQIDFASLRADIGEGVEDVGELGCRQVLWVVVASVDSPVDKVGHAAVVACVGHGGG